MFSGEDDPSIWFPKRRIEQDSVFEKALNYLQEHAPPLKMGDRPIPGAVTILALPLIMVGMGMFYWIQRR